MSLQRADRDLPALTVLALLLTGPRHTYEMHRLMVDTHKDFVTGLPRSMYHAVERLLRAELIEVVRTDRAEGRPERTVYAVTDGGRAELAERVRRLLEHPDPDATLFVAALSFLGCLPAEQARAALDVRRA
jgi:DNA-binding PadR family transcriptional regulator